MSSKAFQYVTAIPVDADHCGIFVYGVIDQKFWFDTIAGRR